ncbi:putative helicase-like protein [Erysiphe neolycopersici]|uniref:Putative helicase-like protein n=1 Tax=Erysiphe neolycopersici TaxID=212602 RepID=A0A420HFB0_9PEZI|nr:putative helicase-like protein [Erysiphe neolycopersici]
MPSFSLFKNRSEETHRVEIAWRYSDVESEKYGKISPRASRRAYIRKLLKKSSFSSVSSDKRVKQQNDVFFKSSLILASKEEKTNDITLASLYKPLPPTPFQDTSADNSVKRPNKTNRIITPLTPTDLQELFSGAPHFHVKFDQDVNKAGLPKPFVSFPWDPCFQTKDLRDHVKIDDPAWACITTSRICLENTIKNVEDVKESERQTKIDLRSYCRELPNMLSMQGLERGSIGFQAALELNLSDRFAPPDYTPQEVSSSFRASFLQTKEKLRTIPESLLVNRLILIGQIYDVDPLQYHKSPFQLYTELFTKILLPSPQILDIEDPHSLQVQIYHLIEILKAPNIWFDFSQLKWRMHLGRILWGTDISETSQTSSSSDSADGIQNFRSQKYWLLLQILLGSEVVLRLDILSKNIRHDGTSTPLDKMSFFGQKRTKSVNWTLLLARTWLENIRLEIVNCNTKDSAWISGEDSNSDSFNLLNILKFQGKNIPRQVSGMLHFAEILRWPNLETLKEKTKSTPRNFSDETILLKTMPGLSTSTSYREVRKFKILERKYDDKVIPVNKWLWDSYVNGLILPGEGLGHLLISSLLENDPRALIKLGHRINPNGAFIYGSRSFWSTSNIVGKVLASRKNSSECIGWVSSDVLPRGVKDGWIDIEAYSNQECQNEKRSKKARIWHKKTVERCGSIIAGADPSSILKGDFVLPSEKPIYPPLTVKFLSLDMFASDGNIKHIYETDLFVESLNNDTIEKTEIPLFSSTMRFLVESATHYQTDLSIDLTHDVFFVTAHPCTPPKNTESLLNSTNSSYQSLIPASPFTRQGSAGHPLHKAFTYTKLPLSHILSIPLKTSFAALLTPPTSPNHSQSSLHTTSSNIPKILVIDCIDQDSEDGIDIFRSENSYDKELLARAICAERGWNALISRRNRCCLACSIREASALGVPVIIRL